jgi:aminodeoxyfutalosine deaminase
MPYPKIELHVHLEATLRPERLLDIARRNGYPLPVDTIEGLTELYEFRDFDHFIDVWILVTNALRHEDDFRQLVVDYAGEAARHGAVYVEGIFSPIERTWRGVDWDEIFTGYCDGAQEAMERHGVEVRLSPDITRSAPLEEALKMVQYAIKYGDRGIVGVGLGGEEALHPPEPFEPAFRTARDGGLGSVPHAGEVAGPRSIWGAIEALRPVRIRHGIRAVEDPSLMREIRDRGIVLDVCPVSNLRTKAVASAEEHPLPKLVEFGIPCSISTDDPEMFDTDLTREYELATSFGISPRTFYEAGLKGALCDAETKNQLEATGQACSWPNGIAT